MDRALPLQQHPTFAQALNLLGRSSGTLTLRDPDGAPIGSAQLVATRLLVMWRIGYVPRGPIWVPGTSMEERAAALAAHPIHLIEADAPCPSLRLAGFRQVATEAHVTELDLTLDQDSRLARMGVKWRGHLRHAERSRLDVEATIFDGNPDHWLLAREAAMRRERRYRTLPQAIACAYAHASPGSARIYVAREAGEPVAAILLLLHAPVATYHIGWTGDRGRALSAHHLLLTRGADDLAAGGFVRLDLGTIDTVANPGLARFKIGSGAQVRALGGSWVRLPFARGLALRSASR